MTNKARRLTYMLLLLCACLLPTLARAAEAAPHVSYAWNEDSTITFTYIDSTARKVVLKGNCMLSREDRSFAGKQKRRRMHEVRQGEWQCTTRWQLPPELYTYTIIVDGKRHTDPLNPDSIWVRNKSKSVLLIDGNPQTHLYRPAHRQGQVESVTFTGESGKTFRMMVYLPHNYCDTLQYPLLYLLHGINGNQCDWLEQGRVGNILDNLIERGDIRPVVAVMPRCLLSEPKHPDRIESTNVFNYAEILRGDFERHFHEIEEYIHTRYAVQRNGNAIAGLSCGARQAANIANQHTGEYTYVGMFSPVVTKKQLPTYQEDTTLYAKYWVGGGTNDWMFLSDARSYAKGLEKRGVEHVYLELKGGHTFTNWRVFVTEFLRWAYPLQHAENKEETTVDNNKVYEENRIAWGTGTVCPDTVR